MISSRYAAYKIIYGVKYKGEKSSRLIDSCIRNYDFSGEDAVFLTGLAYGCLSRLYYLDYLIKNLSKLPFRKISKKTLTVLELSLFQIYFYDSVPSYAVVDEAAKIIKKEDARAKNFVNAVLRKSAKEKIELDYSKMDQVQKFKIKYNISEPIAKRLLKNYGETFTEELLQSMYEKPKVYLRVNQTLISLKDFTEKLNTQKIDYEIMDGKNYMLSLDSLRNLADNEFFKQGLFSLQDKSAAECVDILDPKEGEHILDCCAAPGGKSMYILEKTLDMAKLVSTDISGQRLEDIYAQKKRLKLKNIKIEKSDSAVYNAEYFEKFDRVLCDVPCSGIGVIRRKPEIRYKDLSDMEELNKLQLAILQNGAKYTKKGGVICYSTCTLGREENQDIIQKFMNKNKGFEIISEKEFYPHIDEGDGFFVCKLRKNSQDVV